MCRMILLLTWCAASAVAQTPSVQHIHWRRPAADDSCQVTVAGKGLKTATEVWTPFGRLVREATEKPADNVAAFNGSLPADVPPGIYPCRVLADKGVSAVCYIAVDDLPAQPVTDASEVNPPESACQIPCCLQGLIRPLKPRYFAIDLQSGQQVAVEVVARRLNSSLDPVLSVAGPDGREIEFADDTIGLAGDAALSFTASEAGRYVVALRDVQYAGGASHFFHLRISEGVAAAGTFPGRTSPADSVTVLLTNGESQSATIFDQWPLQTLPVVTSNRPGSTFAEVFRTDRTAVREVEPNDAADAATELPPGTNAVAGRFAQAGDVDWFRVPLEKGQTLAVIAHTRNLGSPSDLVLSIHDATGKQLVTADESGTFDARLTFTAPAAAPYLLAVRELTGSYGPAWTYDLQLERDGWLEATTASDAIPLAQNSCAAVQVDVARFGFQQPFALQPVDVPAGLDIPEVLVQPKQKTATITIRTIHEEPLKPQRLRFHAVMAESGRTVPVLIRPVMKKGEIAPPRNPPRSGIFVFQSPTAAPFVLEPSTTEIHVAAGGKIALPVKAARTKDWTAPIQVTSTVPAAELPAGLVVKAASLKADEGTVMIETTKELVPGHYTLSLQGTAKKDKTTSVQHLPTIRLVVDTSATESDP